MHLEDLVGALLNHDSLAARQWVQDAVRANLSWERIPKPESLGETGLAVAAGIAEVLAARQGQQPPSWTQRVQAAPHPVFLVRAISTMRRLRALCEQEGPEPLRRRRILAPPEFLSFA